MDDFPRKKLIEIIRRDRSLSSNIQVLRGILADYCGGEFRAERTVLTPKAEEDIPKDLISTPKGVPKVLLISRLVMKLSKNRAIKEEAARWAVESWALALGTMTEDDLKEVSPSGKKTSTTTTHPLDPFSRPPLSPEEQMKIAIKEALLDGKMTDIEKMGLESLRLSLGISRETASRLFLEVANQMG